MVERKFDIGMYVIDEDYKIVNYNYAVKEMYPEVQFGDFCYKSIALKDQPCSICPLKADNTLFYNPIRKEWIYANAAKMPYMDHGDCYHVQFQLRQRMDGAVKEALRPENVDHHIAELTGGNIDVSAIGGYCEPGSPIFYANEQLLRMLGYDTLEELYDAADGMVSNTIHPDDVEKVTKDLTKCAIEGGRFESTYRIRHKDGSWSWVVTRGKRIETGNGMYALLCVVNDMRDFIKRQTKLREQNEALLKEELTSKAVLHNMPGGYHRCGDAEGFPFIYVSDSFVEITGWSREEIEKEFHNLFINMVLPEDVPLCAGIITEIAEKGYSNGIYRIKRKGGGYLWVSDSTMRVDLGDESFYHGILADITVYIENMEDAKRYAEETSRAKSTFLFNVSHDIRTPMNAIKGFTHIIDQNAENPQLVREIVEKINKSSDTLMHLLNDVLELSRIESGKDKMELAPHNLETISDKLYAMFEEEIMSKGISFHLENHLQHPLVLCDDLKCTRIVMNMLSNARKFTPAGGTVTFGIQELSEPLTDKKDMTAYRFYVRDTGIGMSEEFQQKAFEEFEREKSSTESKVSGSGLGLAIIKRLVNLMGGTYQLKSKLGMGTEIAVVIPLQITDKNQIIDNVAENKHVDFNGKRVLLVEDNDFNREIAHYILNEMHLEVDEAENGLICVDKILKAQSGYYDVILMDLQMPIMDGYVATKEIRTILDHEKASIPIIAMTANAFEEDKQKCYEIGMNGHIGKPIDANALVQELLRVL